MTPIQINVSVSIGLTPQLTSLAEALICKLTTTTTPAANVETSAVNVATSADNVETSADNVATPAEVAEEPAEEPQADVEKSIADRVKDAIERTRKRIEGDDYEYNMQSELRNKWHRKLTAWFKKTSALYGSDKPTLLPDEDSCRRFIADCDAIQINDDDLTLPVPF